MGVVRVEGTAEPGPAAMVCQAASGTVDADDALGALARVRAARAELDRAEATLIGTTRAAGTSWSQIAAALGLGSYQAAAQRAGRLGASTGQVTNPPPTPRPAGASETAAASPLPARESSRPPDPVGPAEPVTPADPTATAPHDRATTAAATAGAGNSRSRQDRGAPAHGRNTAPTATPRRPSLTTPSVTTIARRRRVTAADFTADPLHDLIRTPDPGRWQVHDPTGVLGEVRRYGRRWQPTAITGEPLGREHYRTRAEAALHVLTTGHTAPTRHRTSTNR